MKIKWKQLIICIAIPLAVGGLSALLTRGGMEDFAGANKPALTPPDWLFPVVWTVLFVLMGVSSYLVFTSREKRPKIRAALKVYGLQLVFNFFWPIFFFNLGAYLFSFVWLVLLWLLIAAAMVSFCKISKPAAYLLLPYLVWVAFAGYLNFAVYLLN